MARGLRGTAAAALALLLLSGTGVSYAGWTDRAQVGGAGLASGALRTDLETTAVAIQRGADVLAPTTPFAPGDAIVVTTAVRLTVSGVTARLTLDAAQTAAAVEAQGIALDAPTVTVTGVDGAAAGATWQGAVTEAHDGGLATATVTLPVSRTQPATAQGRTADLTLTPLTWNLTQEDAR